ncbi:MAG: hypothetical protein IJ719_16310, partial [Clostridia bacterium]|nr:hypothetical protein [Clostridia bacterium]
EADDILEHGFKQGFKQGFTQGLKQGREQQLEEQIDNVVALFKFLYANGRAQDVQKATTDSKLLKKMIKDFSNGKLEEKSN